MKKFFTGGSVTGRNPKLFIGEKPIEFPFPDPVLRTQRQRTDPIVVTMHVDFSEVEKRVMSTLFAKDLLSCFKSSMSFYFFYVGVEVAQTRIDEEGYGAFFAAVKEEVL
jgi:hypothetical protein